MAKTVEFFTNSQTSVLTHIFYRKPLQVLNGINTMVGHEHHHPPVYVVPPAESYKVEDAPELMKLQAKLAKKGLKDPWIRNHVWRYQKKFGTPWSRFGWFFFRGVPTGVIAFAITIAVENALGIDYHPWLHHDEHGEHGKDH